MMRRPTIEQKLPEYLHPFIAKQDYALYTPIDHAAWRFILRISQSFFAKHAHKKYLDGLRETGISLEQIPRIADMDAALSQFGWRAVPVIGFIPPAVFMEFLSLGVLPIACDMRSIEHINYTPAPDIVHEAAGHAPIIADPEYADYLFQYGEVSTKVIFSSQDMAVYEAIRRLSDTKENPKSTADDIATAQANLDATLAAVDHLSEAAILARMNWWTIEYGLVGSIENPKIYGAGILSSMGESFHCFDKNVKKIPFNLSCIDYEYDITKPQPQLFVTPDFKTLSKVLEELAAQMAFRRGGLESLEKAKKAATTTTTVLDSQLQISGTLDEIIAGGAYLRWKGPVALAHHDYELEGHGVARHRDGFGTAVGKIKGLGRSLAELSDAEIKKLGSRIEFESGVVIDGQLKSILRIEAPTLLLTFIDARVTLGSRVLFEPAWGEYDLACGSSVVSVFGGAADRARYIEATGSIKQAPKRQTSNLTEANRHLNTLYARVRTVREASARDAAAAAELRSVFETLEKQYPNDWLLRMELLEFDISELKPIKVAARARLDQLAKTRDDLREPITRGLELLKS